MSDIQTSGIILRYANYSDYDRMITIFSPDYGKIEAIARGCRRPKSKLMNATEPFTSGEFQLFRRKDRMTLEQCKITESYYDLRIDYDRLKHGVYWLKLLESSIMPEVPMPELFLTTVRALAYLCYSDFQPELLTMVFELHLIAQLGLAPSVHMCRRCGNVIDNDAIFDAFSGDCSCLNCGGRGLRISNGARRILLKTPRTSYDKVEFLKDYPYWKEAAYAIRPYIDDRLQQREFAPPLP